MATFKTNDFVVIGNNEGIGKVVKTIALPTQTPGLYTTAYDIATYLTQDGHPVLKKIVSKEEIQCKATIDQINWWLDCNDEWGNFKSVPIG